MMFELGRFIALIQETPNLDWLVLTKLADAAAVLEDSA